MCDLSDPRILETYTSIVEEEPTNWLILGYNDTRDVISLYSKGSEGLNEFRNNLRDEVLYGFVRVDDRFILITWVSDQVSGVRRARALVHSRSVAALLKLHNAQLTASTVNDLSEANIRTRLKLGDSQIPRRSTSNSQKRASRRQSTQSPTSPTVPQSEFVDANETLTPPTPAVPQETVADDQNKLKEQQLEAAAKAEAAKAEAAKAEAAVKAAAAKQKEQEELKRKKKEEEENRAVAAAVAAERESKRLAAEKEMAAKKAEEEKILREHTEQQRAQEEKKLLQQRIMEAEKNKDVVLSGYVSVQPHTSPFWRRRYFTIKGKSMAFFRDELQTTPVIVLDLKNVMRLSSVDVDIETFVPNAFVLETKQNGSYQLFADDKKGLQTILTALQTVI